MYFVDFLNSLKGEQVQEAAGCLGVDSVPRYVNTKQMNELDVEDVILKSNKASCLSL